MATVASSRCSGPLICHPLPTPPHFVTSRDRKGLRSVWGGGSGTPSPTVPQQWSTARAEITLIRNGCLAKCNQTLGTSSKLAFELRTSGPRVYLDIPPIPEHRCIRKHKRLYCVVRGGTCGPWPVTGTYDTFPTLLSVNAMAFRLPASSLLAPQASSGILTREALRLG